MSMLYVHCGIHKTGSSALQTVLAHDAERLKAAGFLVPEAGRGGLSAHHNLAWELSRDRRYNPTLGGMDALRTEIAGFNGEVMISSEDFEGVLMGDRLRRFVDIAAGSGRRATFVVYVRSQTSYLTSLYHQCLLEGFGEDYETFAAEALEQGFVRRREWKFHFDFARALEKLAALDGASVAVRNYHALEGGSASADFLALAGVPAGVIPPDHLQARFNVREPVGASLRRFYANRARRELIAQEAAVVAAMGAQVSAAHNPPWIQQRMREVFEASNALLCRRFDVPPDGLLHEDTPAAAPASRGGANLAKVFSLETAITIRRLALQLKSLGLDPGAPLPERTAQEVRGWHDWAAA